MKIPSRRNIILIILGITILLLGVWYFMRDDSVQDTPQISMKEPLKIETPDQIRVRNIDLILESTRNTLSRGLMLPLPDSFLTFSFAGNVISYQGTVPDLFYDAIGLVNLADPVTHKPYFYALSADKKTYEFLAQLDSHDLSNTKNTSNFYQAGNGAHLFLFDKTDIPYVTKKMDATVLDFSDADVRNKMGLKSFKTCLEIYNSPDLPTKPKSGVYTIDMDGRATRVFCDMQTDGGGWTLFYANNGHPDSPIKLSYVEMRDALTKSPLSDLSNYNDPNLAGLLDFHHFIDSGAKEVLIRNRTGGVTNWVKFSFSTSRALEWALGPNVLGNTGYKCIDLPHDAKWNIINNDAKISYKNLAQIMNLGGTSWGVSHPKNPCNGYIAEKNAVIAFYSASDNKDPGRTRSVEGVGGIWGKENEYRYFFR